MQIFIGVVFAKYIMLTKTVIATFDVHITYSGEAPVYRLYVGDELFAERTWRWDNSFLHERVILEAPYGLYPVRYELLPHPNAEISIQNAAVESGPGRFRKRLGLEVHDESS